MIYKKDEKIILGLLDREIQEFSQSDDNYFVEKYLDIIKKCRENFLRHLKLSRFEKPDRKSKTS